MTLPAQNQGVIGYALTIISPLQHLRMALDRGAQAPLSLNAVARSYRHISSSDVRRVRLHENLSTDREANQWMIHKAADLLAPYLDIWHEPEDTFVSLKVGVTTNDLRFNGKPIPAMQASPMKHLDSPFDPRRTTGTFAENIREPKPKIKDDLSDLRESMQTFGWVEHHPAIIDENDVVIVGHRRLLVAEELGIEPQKVQIRFGSGDPADAERLRLALASNIGNKPFSKADRKRIAERLYGEEGWTLEKIAELLKSSKSSIARDLEGFSHMGKPTRPQGGRPKRSGRPPEKMRAGIEATKRRIAAGEPVTSRDIALEANIAETTAKKAISAVNLAMEETVVPEEPLRAAAMALLRSAPSPFNGEALSVYIEDLRKLL